jgi:NIMA (never in mitosis gene a)-related kinase
MNNFEVISKVGEGAFASVYKVKRKEDSKIYALKKIKISNAK